MSTPPNSLDYLTGLKEATSFKSYDRLKLAIIGKSGVGKSRLAVTAPKPCLVYDFDDRKESIAGIPDVHIRTCVDLDTTNPTAIQSVMRDLATFEQRKRENKELGFKTIVFDSITFMCKAAMNQGMKENSNGVKQLSVAGAKFNLARGYEPYDAEFGIMNNIFQRSFALGVNVIAVCHERAEESERSTQETPIFTGKVVAHPPRINNLLVLFNEKWRMTADAGYKVKVRPDGQFIAATCLNLDSTEEANIENMIKKHMSKEK